MKKIVLLCVTVTILMSCESNRVKQNRETYKNFLYEMSDSKEYLRINSENVKISGEYESKMSFFVDFETKYCGKILKDKIEIQFIGGNISKINGEYYQKYKTNYLINTIYNN